MNQRIPLVIVGAGGLAREMYRLVQLAVVDPRHVFYGFVGSADQPLNTPVGLSSVALHDDGLAGWSHGPLRVVIGIGTPQIVRRIVDRITDNPKLRFPTLWHPDLSIDWDTVTIGVGSRLCAGVAMTCDIEIGAFTLINLGVTIGHDVTIGDCCVVNPGAHLAGHVTVGDGVLIGAGANILAGVTIGEGATVCASSLVDRDVPPWTTVAGVPARPVKQAEPSVRESLPL